MLYFEKKNVKEYWK